jgi:hypothetical protein
MATGCESFTRLFENWVIEREGIVTEQFFSLISEVRMSEQAKRRREAPSGIAGS